MNWKSKYIKYKTKYLELKQKYNQNNPAINPNPNPNPNQNYFNQLEKYYPSCVKKNDSKKENETYGEMEYVGITKLFARTSQIQPNTQYFIDIGSGRGKLPCWFAGFPSIIKSIGIEIVKQRHIDANELKQKLSGEFPDITKKIIFEEGSVEDFDLGNLTNHSANTLIWMSNLCFEEHLTETIFTQLLTQMEKNTLITCSKKPPITIDSNTTNKLKYIEQIEIQMSWWNNLSIVHIYQIV